jgi:hypothetical protein
LPRFLHDVQHLTHQLRIQGAGRFIEENQLGVHPHMTALENIIQAPMRVPSCLTVAWITAPLLPLSCGSGQGREYVSDV